MIKIFVGDCRSVLRSMPAESVHACCTSPPYFALRDYKIEPTTWGGDLEHRHQWMEITFGGSAGKQGASIQRTGRAGAEEREAKSSGGMFCRCGAWRGVFGLEPTLDLYVEHSVEMFREVRRVLRSDGVLWLNLGDSYANDGKWGGETGGKQFYLGAENRQRNGRERRKTGLKPKDMCAVPWRVALALQADGWWLRKALPWLKRNPLPESVEDRPSTALEYVFQLAKSASYYWDGDAVARAASPNTHARISQDVASQIGSARASDGGKTNGNMKAVIRRPKSIPAGNGVRANESYESVMSGQVLPVRNWRDSDLFFDSLDSPHGLICDVDGEPLAIDATTQPFKEAHFATFPPGLVEPLIKASSSEKGCCAKCGAPWRRVTGDPVPVPGTRSSGNKARQGASARGMPVDDLGKTTGNVASHVPWQGASTPTIGWDPTCGCGAEVVPCTILDPFGGAGTTGLVADRLGRISILIELNPEYARMAQRRIADDGGMFADVRIKAAPVPEAAE